jgi:hypothetical protein
MILPLSLSLMVYLFNIPIVVAEMLRAAWPKKIVCETG